jgi:hypothetical protein
MSKQVGQFTISVWDPYPVWVLLEYQGKTLQFSHSEIADLEYAINWAKKAAKEKLGERADEV